MHAGFAFRSVSRRMMPRLSLAISLILLLAACNSGSDSHPMLVQGTPAVGVLKDPPPEPSAGLHLVSTDAGEGGVFNPASTTVSRGQSAILTVLTEPGYLLDSIDGCGGELLAGHRYRTAVLEASCTVTASFVLQEHSVSTMVRSARGGTSSGDGTFAHGTEVTVSAAADPGFEFVAWTEAASIVSRDAEYTFVLEANRSLSASFAEIRNVDQVRMPPAGLVSLFEARHAPAGLLFAATGEVLPADGNAGIWRSEDSGESWTRVADIQARFIAIGVDDPDLVLASTGNGYLLSRDGGREWTPGSVTLAGGQAVPLTDAALASEAGGMFVSSAGVTTAGVYRSLDGGISWERILSPAQAPRANIQIRTLEVSPADSGVVHALTGGNTDIWRSVDGGDSFASIRAGIANDRPQVFGAGVAGDPSSAERLLVENHTSLNGGANWTQFSLPPRTVELEGPDGSFPVELGEETASPANTVWLDGVLLRVSGNRLLVSRDAGLVWESLLDLTGATGDFDTARLQRSADALYLQLADEPRLVHRLDLDIVRSALEED